ncbi:MAG: hypothetical protein J6B93_01025, partial [Clostridia bacterium]|nr:hypothetical protein [Clostridia bacterium]
MRKLITLALAAVMVLTAAMPAYGAKAEEKTSAQLEPKQGTYYAYLEELGVTEQNYPEAEIKINALTFAEASGLGTGEVQGKPAVLLEKTG